MRKRLLDEIMSDSSEIYLLAEKLKDPLEFIGKKVAKKATQHKLLTFIDGLYESCRKEKGRLI